MTTINETNNISLGEDHRKDIIVFATDNLTSMALGNIIAKGFPCNKTLGKNNDVVTTIFNDCISFSTGGEEYLINLAKAISYITHCEVFLRLADKNFSVTANSEPVEIEQIPEPIAMTSVYMKGPARGWAGATRVSLKMAVRKFGNTAFIEEMKKFVEKSRPCEMKTVTKKVLSSLGVNA